MPVIYYAYILCNMHGYENNIHVMEPEVPGSYSKQADDNIYI